MLNEKKQKMSLKSFENEVKEFLTLQVISKKEILNIEEAAMFTGYSKSYLYKLNSIGSDLPVYSASKGSKLFFKKRELEQWQTACKRTKVSDIESKINKYLNK